MEDKRLPSITESLRASANDLRQGFENVPHIKTYEYPQPTQPQQPPVSQPVQPPQPPQPVQQPIPHPTYDYDPSINKARKWMFWILTILIGGLALILIIWRILLRFI